MTTITNEYGTAIGYFVKSDYTKKGEYKRTLVDDQKDAAGMLIKAVDGDYYTIDPKGKIIEGKRGVRRYSNGYYAVTENVLRKLEKRYVFAFDF